VGGTPNIGVASYSLRNFPRDKAIEMVKALGTPYVNFKSVHLPFELSPDQLAAARRDIEAAGIVIVGGGVITFEDDTDPGVEKYFAYAKAAGMPLIAIHTDPRLLPRIERFAKQYDIKVAIHNHGPEDKHFPSTPCPTSRSWTPGSGCASTSATRCAPAPTWCAPSPMRARGCSTCT